MFDPVRSYDKPGVIIGQLINGVATTSSVRGTLFDPSSLSPRERKSFADSMKESVGGGDFVQGKGAVNLVGQGTPGEGIRDPRGRLIVGGAGHRIDEHEAQGQVLLQQGPEGHGRLGHSV